MARNDLSQLQGLDEATLAALALMQAEFEKQARARVQGAGQMSADRSSELYDQSIYDQQNKVRSAAGLMQSPAMMPGEGRAFGKPQMAALDTMSGTPGSMYGAPPQRRLGWDHAEKRPGPLGVRNRSRDAKLGAAHMRFQENRASDPTHSHAESARDFLRWLIPGK